MKQIKVNAYEYSELNQDAKHEVVHWLDEMPLDYETEDEHGNTIIEIEYFSEMEEQDIQEKITNVKEQNLYNVPNQESI